MVIQINDLTSLLKQFGVAVRRSIDSDGLVLQIRGCQYYAPSDVQSAVETLVAHNVFQWNEVVWC